VAAVCAGERTPRQAPGHGSGWDTAGARQELWALQTDYPHGVGQKGASTTSTGTTTASPARSGSVRPMGLVFRKSFRGPRRTRIHASRSGVSVSKRFGPFTVSSRGYVTVRILPGISWRIF
jgi:hypothetical protein